MYSNEFGIMRNVIKDILVCGIMFCLLALAHIFIINNHTYLPPIKEKAIVGGIEIGTDSLVAVRNIQKRLSDINDSTTQYLWQRDDSTGYYYRPYNETFYVKIEGGEVYEIYFHSDSLSAKEVELVSKHNRYHHNRMIYHKGEKFTIHYDGRGTYKVYKNKLK